MTDKEWYATLSTLVLEGIDCLNRGENTRGNQLKIERFVRDKDTPEQTRTKRRKKVYQGAAEATKNVGYIGGILFMTIGGTAWLMYACGEIGLGVPVGMTCMAAAMGAMGLAGQIWYDLI